VKYWYSSKILKALTTTHMFANFDSVSWDGAS